VINALLKYWEEIIAKAPVEKRTGRWHVAYCIATPKGKSKVVGTDHEVKFFSPSSNVRFPGWPVSSVQGSMLFNKPHSEHTAEEREVIKKMAAEKLLELLDELV
jgi:hypothetical protein